MQPRLEFVQCLHPGGLHRMAYAEWGDRDNADVVVCAHGLSRNGRDFDTLAKALLGRHRVICPDIVGRGRSDRLANYRGYVFPQYVADCITLIARLGVDKVSWVGTSMGGLIGITLAAGPLRERITRLVVNDIGPDIPQAGTGRIASYVGNPPVYDTMAELEAWLRSNYAPFGDNTEAFWRRMADTSARRTDDGRVTVHYDPAIVTQFTHHKGDLDVWDKYDAVTARTLLIRGIGSDVLPADVAEAMTRRGPKPRLVTLPGYGHAPTLANAHEIGLLREFLAS